MRLVGSVDALTRCARRSGIVRGDELDARIHPYGGEDPAGNRIKERLAKLPIGALRNERREFDLHHRPEVAVGDRISEKLPDPLDNPSEDSGPQIQPRQRVLVCAFPVSLFKAGPGTATDPVELGLVDLETVPNH